MNDISSLFDNVIYLAFIFSSIYCSNINSWQSANSRVAVYTHKHFCLSIYIHSKDFLPTPSPPVGCSRSSSQLWPQPTHTTAGSLRLSLEADNVYRERLCVCVCEIIWLRPHVNTLTLCESLCATTAHSWAAAVVCAFPHVSLGSQPTFLTRCFTSVCITRADVEKYCATFLRNRHRCCHHYTYWVSTSVQIRESLYFTVLLLPVCNMENFKVLLENYVFLFDELNICL